MVKIINIYVYCIIYIINDDIILNLNVFFLRIFVGHYNLKRDFDKKVVVVHVHKKFCHHRNVSYLTHFRPLKIKFGICFIQCLLYYVDFVH